MYSLELPHRGDYNEYTQHTIIVTEIKKKPLNYRYLLPELAPWLTLSGSNHPCLEQFSMVPKMFEPSKFDSSLLVTFAVEKFQGWKFDRLIIITFLSCFCFSTE